jgi:pseudouridine kinase
MEAGMTKREIEIIKILKENPLISQNEIADLLNITRSSIGVHISNLIKKGYIKGKGYIINEEPYVCILGGANMDIQGFPKNTLVRKDSNPGNIKISLGGVGRNIGENLIKLGVRSKLITVLGSDIYAREIIEHSKKIGLEIEDSLFLENETGSTYLSILNSDRDMELAISSMDIFEKMTIDFMERKEKIIGASRVCVIDTNIPANVIEHVVKTKKDKVFFLDTVSTTKAMKIKDIIGYFHTIKPNKYEAEILSGITIKNDRDLEKAGEFFIEKGCSQVFISMGPEGLYYTNGKQKGKLKRREVEVVNATGAGDAFVAGLVYSYINQFEIEEAAIFAESASVLTLMHEDTINPKFDVENIEKIKKER